MRYDASSQLVNIPRKRKRFLPEIVFEDIFSGSVVFGFRVILAMLLDETIKDVVDMSVIGVEVFFHGVVVAVCL